nr:hypothetical protein [Tanacetum cinerariifolium]
MDSRRRDTEIVVEQEALKEKTDSGNKQEKEISSIPRDNIDKSIKKDSGGSMGLVRGVVGSKNQGKWVVLVSAGKQGKGRRLKTIIEMFGGLA